MDTYIYMYIILFLMVLPLRAPLVAQLVKNLSAIQEAWVPWVGKIPWRRERLPTPVFWPGEFHGLYIVHGVTKSQIQLGNFHLLRLKPD